MAPMVRFRVLDEIALITLDTPLAHHASTTVLAGLWEAFQKVISSDGIKAAVLTSTGPLFSTAGGIADFDGYSGKPTLGQLCALIESSPKPVVAAAKGRALGAGAELMLAAHYRVVSRQTLIAFPEVVLGVLPSAGGTQRLPRLIDVELALETLLKAKAIYPDESLEAGLIDAVIPGELRSGAVAFAKSILEQGKGARPTGKKRARFSDGRSYWASIAQARATLKTNPQHAPDRIVDCLEAAALLPFEAGLAFEEDAFARCSAHPQSTAFTHVFEAEQVIDRALAVRNGVKFVPVEPMGKAAVERLKDAMQKAAEHLLQTGLSQDDIDAAMVDYGFRRGPLGSKPEGVPNPDITRKIIGALVAEGGLCVEQGAVQRSSDIDILAIHGAGFPRRMGGPMRAAQTEGLLAYRNDMRDWAQASKIWAVPAILDEAVKHAGGFDAVK